MVPHVVNSLRPGISAAIISVVPVELFASQAGLGNLINFYFGNLMTALMCGYLWSCLPPRSCSPSADEMWRTKTVRTRDRPLLLSGQVAGFRKREVGTETGVIGGFVVRGQRRSGSRRV